MSLRTERAYVGWMRRFIYFKDRRHPEELGEAEVVRFLSALATERHVAASTQIRALAALLFLHRDVLGHDLAWMPDIVRAKRPDRIPVVLTRQEVARVLGALNGVQKLAASLLHGAGLRVLEALNLRVKDVDFGGWQVVVRDGKGRKDRVTLLPASLREPLRAHLSDVEAQHTRDLRTGAGCVELPDALRAKYPSAPREWSWQWVFPATRGYLDTATGERRRHHLRETVICWGPVPTTHVLQRGPLGVQSPLDRPK